MIEETIQGIIVTAVAIAPVLYIFLRKWVSKHRGRRRDTPRQETARRDTPENRAASPSSAEANREGGPADESRPRRGLARLLRRARRPKPGRLPPLPPRQDRDPKPIFDRLRSAETPAPEAAGRGQTLTNWNSSLEGERSESVGAGAQSASPAVGGQPIAGISSEGSTPGGRAAPADARKASARTWRRIDRLPGLKRAIILREILGPPRSLGRSDEPPAPW